MVEPIQGEAGVVVPDEVIPIYPYLHLPHSSSSPRDIFAVSVLYATSIMFCSSLMRFDFSLFVLICAPHISIHFPQRSKLDYAAPERCCVSTTSQFAQISSALGKLSLAVCFPSPLCLLMTK
jgi:hypothetical protein